VSDDVDIEFAPELPKVELPAHTVDGYEFAFDEAAADIPAIWGANDEILWASGEPLMIVAPEGCGKTTIAQQIILRRTGILRGGLLGLPIRPASPSPDRCILYIAADRPRQASRSFRRMVSAADEELLRQRLVVHRGPLPFDISKDWERGALADYARSLDATDVIIDSLKDIAVGLASDEIGAAVNIAFQQAIADGHELLVLHHHRKQQPGAPAPKQLADVYGSRWLTAGMGSVILLWGEPGDPIVQLRHLKQPLGEVGPFDVLHDHTHGASSVHDHVSLEQLLASSPAGLNVRDSARLWFKKDEPNRNEIEKTRRKLEALVGSQRAERHDDPSGAAHYQAKTAP
jgi:replicative DNA helicase